MHHPRVNESDDLVSDLVDLSDVDLDRLTLGDSVLANALQMIRAEVDRPEEAVAGFNSSL